jgi:hypothetical protein
MPADTDEAVKVTVEQDGEVVATMTFGDRNMVFAIGDVHIVSRNAVVESVWGRRFGRESHTQRRLAPAPNRGWTMNSDTIEIAMVGIGTFRITSGDFVFASMKGRQGVFTVPVSKQGESIWRLIERLGDVMASSEEMDR